MSRAFVRENEQDPGVLPELAVSPHPNWVTAAGYSQLQARVAALEAERRSLRPAMEGAQSAATGAFDMPSDAASLARIERDLRYFRARLASARLVEPAVAPTSVRFGASVELAYADGALRRYRIVGEDEADPASGLVSWVSPLARALEGAEPGDSVAIPGGEVEVVSVAR
jgi:transcription elongation GreA/GreB family factor